jgi:hypothetical protein
MLQRLDKHHYPYFHQRLDYPQAGHDVGGAIPYRLSPTPVTLAAPPRATALAKPQLWPAILDFLRRHA